MKQLDVIEVAPYLAADTNKLRTKIVSLYRKLLQLYGDDIKNLILSDTTFSAAMQLLLSEDVILLVKSLDDEFKTEEATKVITISNEVLKIAPQKINMNTNCKPSMLETSCNKASEKLASLEAKQNAQEEKKEPEKVEQAQAEEEKEPDSKKELRAKIKKEYAERLEGEVKYLTNVMVALYGSGFTTGGKSGLLVNFEESQNSDSIDSPLIRYNINENRVVSVTDNILYEKKLMREIKNQFPQLAKYASTKDNKVLPDINALMSNQDNVVCHKLHIGFQTANVKYCTGEISIRRWITETKVGKDCKDADEWLKNVNKNTCRLVKMKDIKSWYSWCINNIMVECLMDAGVKSINDDILADKVILAVRRNLKNAVVESDKIPKEQLELRISTDQKYDVDNFIDCLRRSLNSDSMDVVQTAKQTFDATHVLTVKVIIDKEKANRANIFAADIIENLLESGSRPSWDNAMLGRKEDGDILYWTKFMDPSKASPSDRCYTIYAGSRSGKGVMTSTLVANALSDGKQVFYTDGKPENGVCVGDIAWSVGKEAYVFDGKEAGKDPFAGYMEEYTNGVRQPSEVSEYLTQLPKELFESSEFKATVDIQKFLGVMRYLKSLSLCASIIDARSSGKIPADNWQVWVFDEVSNMSTNELGVREKFASYLNTKGIKISPSLEYSKLIQTKGFSEMTDSSSDKYDAGVAYINDWVKWLNSVEKSINTAATISLGKANLNLIFIFQEPKWLSKAENGNQDKHYGLTTLAAVVKNLKSTKIAGRNAIPTGGGEAAGDYGDATLRGEDWVKKINIEGGGWWYISSGSNIKQGGTLFKPLNVWTVPLGPSGKMISMEELKRTNPSAKEAYYFKGYINMLFSAGGISGSPADILASAYNYADNAVKELGLSESGVKEYIYNCMNFAGNSTGVSLEDVAASYDEDGTGSNMASGPSSIPFSATSTPQIGAGSTQESTFISDDDYKSQHGDEPSLSQSEQTTSDNGPVFISDDDYKSQFNSQDTQSDDSGVTFISDDDYKSQFGEQTDVDNTEYPDEEPKVSSEDKQLADENIRKMNEMLQQLEKTGKLFDEADLKSHMDDDGYRKYNELRQQQEEVLQQIKTVTELARVGLMRKNEEPSFNINSTNNVVINNYNSPELQGHVAPMSAAKHIFTGMNMGIQSMHSKLSLMRNPSKGTEQIFKELIQHIKTVGVRVNTAGYLRVANQENGNMQVGNRLLDYKGFTNANNLDINTVRPSDIVSLNVIAKEFKTLNRLELDNPSLMKVYSEINKSGKTNLGYPEVIERIFKRIPSLVEFTYSDSSGQKQTISRMDLSTNKAMAAIDRLEKQNQIVSRLEAASLNRGDGNGTSRKVRAAQTVAYMKAAGIAQGTPKKLAKIGGTTAVAATVGLVFGPVFAVGAGLAGLGFGIKTLVNLGKQGGGTSSKSVDKDE